MADTPIDISKGLYLSANPSGIADSGHASKMLNLLIDDSGSNVSRPGLTEFVDLGDSPVIGMADFDDQMVAVTQDRKIWKVSQSKVAIDIGDTNLAGLARPIFARDGSYLAIAGGLGPKQWDGSSAQTAALAGSPDDCSHIVYHDGYWLQNSVSYSQRINFAGPTAATRAAWSVGDDFFSAEGHFDAISSLGVLLDEVYAFGPKSYQKFQNVGDAITPYAPSFGYNGSGIIAPYTLVEADNRFWYLSSDKRFVKLDGVTPVQVDTPFDQVIKNLSIVSDCVGFRVDVGGYYLIVWRFPSEGKTYVHDYKAGHWYEWDTQTVGLSANVEFNAYAKMSAWNKDMVGSPTDGKIYCLDFDSRTDDSLVLRCLRRQIVRHQTGRRKKSNGYLVTIERGQTHSTGSNQEPILEFRVKDDSDGWTEPQRIGLGFEGDTTVDVRIDGLRGIYRQREIELKLTDAVGFKIKNPIIEDVELLRN